MKRLILYGCGYPVITKLLEFQNSKESKWDIVGFVDEYKYKKIDSYLGYPVIGDDNTIQAFVNEGYLFYNNVTSNCENIEKAYNVLKSNGATITKLIMSEPPLFNANVNDIGEGSIISPDVLIDPNTKIGRNVVVRQKALIAHDSTVGDFCFIGPGAYLLGGARVGNRTYVGSKAVIKNHVSVGDNCTIGMGAVIQKDVPDNVTVAMINGQLKRFNN